MPTEMGRDLEALDRALAGEPADRAWAELVEDVRAVRPEPAPAFLERLDERVREGFPRTPTGARRAPWARFDRSRTGGAGTARAGRRVSFLAPAFGIAAAALAALVVVVGVLRDGGTDATSPPVTPAEGSPGGSAAREPAPRATAPEQRSDRAGAPAPSAVAPPQPTTPIPPPGTSRGERRVERSASLTLATRDADVQDVADDVVRTADRFDAVVLRSAVDTGDSGGEATFELRVPTHRVDEALAALSELAHVSSRSQGTEDITGSFASVEDRLADARAERRGLLRALGRAGSAREVRSLRARLRLVRAEIDRLHGELSSLRRRASTASVSVTVEGGARTSGDEDDGAGGAWTPGDAARDALRVLEVAAGVVIVTAAALAPLGLLALLLALARGSMLRRRREAALDAG